MRDIFHYICCSHTFPNSIFIYGEHFTRSQFCIYIENILYNIKYRFTQCHIQIYYFMRIFGFRLKQCIAGLILFSLKVGAIYIYACTASCKTLSVYIQHSPIHVGIYRRPAPSGYPCCPARSIDEASSCIPNRIIAPHPKYLAARCILHFASLRVDYSSFHYTSLHSRSAINVHITMANISTASMKSFDLSQARFTDRINKRRNYNARIQPFIATIPVTLETHWRVAKRDGKNHEQIAAYV